MSPLSVAVRRAAFLLVPFVAVFTAAITLSPHAAAQYPGGYPGGGSGGGYPGGGSYPGSFGWAAQPRPGNTPITPYRFQDYDWTGMPVTATVTDYAGKVYDSSYTTAPNIGHGGTLAEHDINGTSPFNSVGSGSYAAASMHFTVTGTATYKWRWVPPLNAAGQPDLVNFPAPPLFVLGRVDGHVWTDPRDLTNTLGLTAAGALDSGFGDGWGGKVSSYPQLVPAAGTGPARKVLAAGAGGQDAQLYSVGMSPSVSLDIAGISIGPGSTEGHPIITGNGGGSAAVNAQPFPITLSAPNPLTNPQLGDGTNQYAYDSGLPGKVNVPAVISLPGASTDDTSWMVTGNHADVAVVSAISGQQPHIWEAFENYIGFGGYFTYAGLPTTYNGSLGDSNSFGNHLAVMKVDGRVSQFAHFQTFFDGQNTTSNWPNSDGSPDWFHYYDQIYHRNQFNYNGQSYELIDGGYRSDLGPLGASQVRDTEPVSTNPAFWQFNIVLGPNTLNTLDLPVFDVNASGKIQNIGVMKIKGIHQWERVCAHEQAHIKLELGCKDQTGIFFFPKFYDAQGNPVNYPWMDTSGNPIVDTTGGGIPDNVKIKYGLNPDSGDSTLYFTYAGRVNADAIGDVECLCEIAALGEVLNRKDWKLDWSNEGLQYGQHPTQARPNYNGPFGSFFPFAFSVSSYDNPVSVDLTCPPKTVPSAK